MGKLRPLIVALLCLLSSQLLFVSAHATETVVWDETAAWWTQGGNTLATDDYVIYSNGSMSVNVVTTGSGSIYHTFALPQNWNGYDGISFWWYGNGSNADITFQLLNSSWTGTFHGHFVDSTQLKGVWHQFFMYFSQMTNSSLPLSTVGVLQYTGLPTTNAWNIDRIALFNSVASTEVTSQMISTDWLTFGGLVFLSILGVIFVLKSRNYLLNFIFGAITFGAGAYLLGTDMILSGWINLLAIMMGLICMTDAIVIWRSG